VKIGFKFQSLGKISNNSTADPHPPVLLDQFQHWGSYLKLPYIVESINGIFTSEFREVWEFGALSLWERG